MIPVVCKHDTTSLPIGKVDFEENKAVFKMFDGVNIKAENLSRVCPAFIIKKQDKDGNVLEADLLHISLDESNV